MGEYDDNENWMETGPIVVRRTVYEAANAFEKSYGTPGCIGEAQDRMDRYKAAGNERAMRRWRDIYRYLMTVAASDDGVETVILKTGEKYDYENDKVIKPRAHPQRSGKASR